MAPKLSNIVSLNFKQTERIALTKVLREYVLKAYGEHPDAYTDDFRVLDELRTDCLNLEVHRNALHRLLKYYGQLVFIGSKFPIDVGIEFPWKSSFSNADEKPAAMYSQLGISENRSSPEGVKRACQHFQNAAGCFQHLDKVVVPEMRIAPPLDMSTSTLRVLINTMLAQAQECFWQKAIYDNMKDGVIAKLASQVSHLYDIGYETASNNPEVTKLLGQLITHLNVKSWYFRAAAEFRKSNECISQNKYGEEIARLHVADGYIRRCLENKKLLHEFVITDLESLLNVVSNNLKRAEKDNDIIYLQTVPATSSLSTISKANMTEIKIPPEVENPISLMNGTSILGFPLFAKLVPFAVHQAHSVYSDRKEKLVKDILTKLIDLPNISTRSLNLPNSIENLNSEGSNELPPSLMLKAQEIRNEGGAVRLNELHEQINRLSSRCNELLDKAFAVLDQEITEDEDLQSSYAGKWNRPKSQEVNKNLVALAQGHRSTLEKALKSDFTLGKMLNKWSEIINILASDNVILCLFYYDCKMIGKLSLDDDDATTNEVKRIANELRDLMNQVNDLKKEIQNKTQEVKRMADLDDIESARITSTGTTKVEPAHFEDLFNQQLAKYDKFFKYIQQATIVQENLHNSINVTRRRTKFVNTERDSVIQQLEIGYEKFKEIQKFLSHGIKIGNDVIYNNIDFHHHHHNPPPNEINDDKNTKDYDNVKSKNNNPQNNSHNSSDPIDSPNLSSSNPPPTRDFLLPPLPKFYDSSFQDELLFHINKIGDYYQDQDYCFKLDSNSEKYNDNFKATPTENLNKPLPPSSIITPNTQTPILSAPKINLRKQNRKQNITDNDNELLIKQTTTTNDDNNNDDMIMKFDEINGLRNNNAELKSELEKLLEENHTDILLKLAKYRRNCGITRNIYEVNVYVEDFVIEKSLMTRYL
ncbi:2172_t:CDS:10 [Entrophospora sp. SA101]|nr:2172_t:CDS:10 [Entrophospora sp. SA101]